MRESFRITSARTSDSMSWISGGGFILSCALLLLFVGHILYHSLQSHWPRRVAIMERSDGTILGGEIHGNSKRLGGGQSTEWLIKVGGGRPNSPTFLNVQSPQLAKVEPIYPKDLIFFELRESEPIFGFLTSLSQVRYPLLAEVAVARVFLTELEAAQNRSARSDSELNEFERLLPAALEALNAAATEPIAIPIEYWRELLKDFENIVALNAQTIQAKQIELSRIDQKIEQTRKLGRRIGGTQSQTMLSAIDEIFRLAFELGAAEQATYDLEVSRDFWKEKYQFDPLVLLAIDDSFERLRSDLASRQEALQIELDQRVKHGGSLEVPQPLSTDSTNRVDEGMEWLIETAQMAKSAYSDQLKVNTDLAELDLVRQAFKAKVAVLFGIPVPFSEDRQPRSEEGMFVDAGLVAKRVGQTLEYRWNPSRSEQVMEFGLLNKQILCADAVRFYFPNELGVLDRLALFVERWLEFLFDYPRRNGLAGGVFPALWGTVVMTILMSVMVMPFGVMAAIYMQEYARNGVMLSIVRITVNNLAGVPSIVYGVFGLAFFSYLIGGFIDGGPQKIGLEPLGVGSWWLMALATLIAIVWLGYRTLKPQMKFVRPSLQSANRFFSLVLLVIAVVGGFLVIAKVPFFEGLYSDELPNPTYGKGCLLWASFTMALLTLPIVIVTTEEALASVPSSLKEGSYACGATKWQTIRRLVLPYARPGIITGLILSVARGAGEVAPLMLVGVIPLAADLPLDTQAPFLHGSRSFMHLGYHIYWLGLQNQDIHSARPMVYSTIAVLILIVFALNSCAIWLRSRIKKQIQSQYF
ncbi:PstA family ABC transporter permease [Pirellulaceae bacterium SH449]